MIHFWFTFQIRKFSLLSFVLVEASPSPKSLILFTSFLNSDQLEPQAQSRLCPWSSSGKEVIHIVFWIFLFVR
nr:hypothetical protein CFP56_17599 [Quercus suber]